MKILKCNLSHTRPEDRTSSRVEHVPAGVKASYKQPDWKGEKLKYSASPAEHENWFNAVENFIYTRCSFMANVMANVPM